MKFQTIANFLATTPDDKDLPRFVTKKMDWNLWSIRKNYSPNKEIRTETSMLRSDLCNFSDAYIVVEGDVTLEGDNNSNKRN